MGDHGWSAADCTKRVGFCEQALETEFVQQDSTCYGVLRMCQKKLESEEAAPS